MDKTAIKNYAVAARRNLMDAVRTKMASLYICEYSVESSDKVEEKLHSDGIFLTKEQLRAREKLCAYLVQLRDDMGEEMAFSHVLEEVAYTWFNRLIALRYMEVNDYLPSGIRVLSSVEPGRAEPDAMRETERLPYVDQVKVSEYRADVSPGADERLYKYILISQCNALSEILPGMFQTINDYTELLLPDSLYQRGGIVHDLVNAISEDDFDVEKEGQIQIIGWMYQYYISEKKDEVFAALKKNVKINKETIPAVTQLFTPEWIVKYMVENSLGRLWLEREKAESGLTDEYMNANDYGWKYYVEEAEQEPEVAERLRVLRAKSPIKRPEDIKLIDPCMGSGHILVYVFDVLYRIYTSQGYAEREIPNLILTHNIYGLDIDGRAGQLAYFALMMKARSYNRRFFRQENVPQPHVYAFVESDGIQRRHLDYMGEGMSVVEREQCKDNMLYLIELFSNARDYGSILNIEQELDFEKLNLFIRNYRVGQMVLDIVGIHDTQHVLSEVLTIAAALGQKYDIAVTNPPYMAPTPPQADWAKKNYPNSKNDLCVMFVERNFDFLKQSGYLAMITMHSWMFLSSYEKFRERLIDTRDIVNLAHLGARAFEEIGGEVVQTTVFAMRCYDVLNYLGTYARLVDYANQQAKENAFLMGSNRFFTKKRNFEKIPSRPVAYWVSERFADTFTLTKLGEIAKSCIGMRTGNNALFLRYWYETSYAKILFSACSAKDVVEKEAKWIPYNKGGEFRKWYGNQEYIVNWEDNGHEIKENTKRAYPQLGNNLGWKITNEQFYFQGGISWTVITNNPCFRRYYNGYIFSNSGQSVISIDPKLLDYLTGLLNTKYAESVLKIISPTLGFESGYVSKIPVIIDHNKIDIVISLVNETITISRTDWDNFETSWNFKQHPLIKFSMTEAFVCGNAKPSSGISSSFRAWNKFAETQFDILKSNETKLNRIFIDMYDLQDELTPEVDDKDVSIRKADLGRDIRSFLSYTVGCMFGRYSLDEPGLVFAGGEFDMLRYETYTPEDDNILPIGSSDYFNDDIVVRFVDFVRTVYGDTTLDENLNFIADALYPNANGSAKEKIRRYFLNDFYKDHLKIYQKRPIYWMLDSGKKNGFKALFYLHRYDKYTIACARTDYLHPLQRKYEAEINRLEMLSGTTENAREKAGYRKEVEVLQSKIAECRSYDQVVAHIAHQQIDLDLDDGVKVNYAKFQGVEVPLDNGKIVKMDLLGKI